jgi:type IV pilus assembly protein PilX
MAVPRQVGIVLFFALLALAVMSIAAVALIRSVDTNALLSGNLVFRQSASAASNVVLEGVAESISKSITITNSNSNHAAQGYYANCGQFDTQPDTLVCDGSRLTTMTWNATNSSLAPNQTDGNDEIRNGIDRQGNEIRYVVERMCNYSNADVNAGNAPVDSSRCLMASARACGEDDSKNGNKQPEILPCNPSSDFPLYRVTLRIIGPKNTVTFMQAFISN